jgi:hypothetical protein
MLIRFHVSNFRSLRDELDALRRHSAPIHGAPIERRSGIDAPRLTIPPPAA